MSDSLEKREPFLSIRAVLFLGGALIWAANQNWLEMASFFQLLAETWRDFLRALWTAAIEQLKIPIQLAPHQKDVLSLITILAGSAIYRVVIGKRPQALFFPSFNLVQKKITEKFGKMADIAEAILNILFFLFVVILYILVLLPFVDTVRFSHDVIFLVIVGFFFFTVLTNRSSAKKFFNSIGRIWSAVRRGHWRYIKRSALKFTIRFLLVSLVLVGVVALAWIGKLIGLSGFIESILANLVDPEPFKLTSYVGSLGGEAGPDLFLICVACIFLFLTSGKSLRPLAQFVCLGSAIVLLGWVSGVVVEMNVG